MGAENWISLLGIFSGIGAFWIAYKKYQESFKQREEAQKQYQRAQDWKRLEFIAKEMRDFGNIADVRNAIDMMSWLFKEIEFFPNSKNPKRNLCEKVFSKNIRSTFEKLNQGRYLDSIETLISETFEIFFQEVERLNSFVETKLVSAEELYPFIYFWVYLLNDPENYAIRTFSEEKDQKEYVDGMMSLKKYIEREDYSGILNLLKYYKNK